MYANCLKSYENKLKEIPNAPPPYPLQENTILAFIEYMRHVHNSSYHYLKLMTAVFSYYITEHNQTRSVNFILSSNFKNYMKGLSREMNGGFFPNATKPFTPINMVQFVKFTLANKTQKNIMYMLYYGHYYTMVFYESQKDLILCGMICCWSLIMMCLFC